MNYCKSILICGGDKRQKYMYKQLSDDGFCVSTCALGMECDIKKEDIGKYDVIILPVPVSRDGVALNAPMVDYEIKLGDILGRLSKSQLVVGGMCDKLNFDIKDYYKSENVLMQNAAVTAEGALRVAMENCDFTLNGSEILILGYGRIGKLLAKLLNNLGASVTVSARKDTDISLAAAMGHRAIKTADAVNTAGGYDIIFNTIPYTVLDSKALGSIPKSTLIIELAGKPYGIDMEAAKVLGRKVVIASGLPGKYTPETAGKILKKEIIKILETEV